MTTELLQYFTDWNWAVLLVFIVTLYIIKWYRRPYKFPPGPRGIPVFGYLPFIGRYPERTAYELSKQYGPLMSIRLGSNDLIFLNDLETINKSVTSSDFRSESVNFCTLIKTTMLVLKQNDKYFKCTLRIIEEHMTYFYDSIIRQLCFDQAFVKGGDAFHGRPSFLLLEKIKKGDGLVFIDSGDKHRSQRKFGLMTLRGFGVGKKGMENICLEESYFLNEEIRSKNGKAFNISPLLHNAVSNNICHVVFGRRFTYNDKLFKQMIDVIIDGFEGRLTAFANLTVSLAPVMKYFPPFSYLTTQFTNSIIGIFDWVKGIAKEHEETFDENSLRDFIDAFILEKRKGEDPFFTDLQLANFIHELFLAGTGTVSNTMYWALLCLINYPEAQEKLRTEILRELGTSGIATMSKKPDMPYTCAFIQELFRYRSVAPLGLQHKTTQDVEMSGYRIPKGTIVQANLWAVHNNPSLWKNPEKFVPERFLDKEGNFTLSNHVIPFSIGPRHCLGEQLARMEVFIFLVGLIQKFEFLPDPDAKSIPTIENGVRSLGFSPFPYDIVAKEL